MKKLKYTLFVLLMIFQSSSGAVGKRIALVIGNSAYSNLNQLSNPDNDANAIAVKLKTLGFQLMDVNGRLSKHAVLDLNEDNFLTAIGHFSQQAQGAEMAMIYYAGHGMQFGTDSYLLPVDVPKDDINLLQRHAISLDSILKNLDGKAELTIAVFDACREIPELASLMSDATRSSGLSRSDYRGLGRVKSQGRSRVIAFSGAAGQLVKDGSGQHSPYTEQLLQQLDTPNQEVGDIFRNVAYRFGQQHTGQQPVIEIQGVPPKHFYFIQHGGEGKPEKKYQYPLYVKTTPADAKVRILNIGPVYQAGMLLKPGSYKIEVSKLGYQRQLSNFDLTAETNSYYVELQAVSSASSALIAPVKLPEKRGFTDPITGMKFVPIKAGCFQMGSNDGQDDEKPVHRVCLSAYAIGKYEVTQAQWQKVMGNNPSSYKGSNKPVEQVSWDDVQGFIRKLNQQTQQNYRLPTEAEWEYACRSGGKEQEYCGSNNANSVAWYGKNSGSSTHDVGQKQANGSGLYDMSGNVYEWVSDWYDKGYYKNSPTNNPQGPSSGRRRVYRGGGWYDGAYVLRSADRYDISLGYRHYDVGFRLVRKP